jgi:hypothetical protein
MGHAKSKPAVGKGDGKMISTYPLNEKIKETANERL